MSSNDLNANMMNLCRVLVGTGQASDEARDACASVDDRVKLFEQYGIAARNPGDPGYELAHYEQGDNFNRAIEALIGMATQILASKSSQATADRKNVLDDWEQTDMFEFLYDLTQDAALRGQLQGVFPSESTTEQQQFLNQHLPENYYAEREAIRALLVDGKDSELGQSMSKIITTFEANYQFGC